MKPHVRLVGPHLQAFFSEHLCNHKRASPQTIASCRDTFRLLLQFLKKATGIEPAAMKTADIDAPAVLAFLDISNSSGGIQCDLATPDLTASSTP